jgi:PAS domain S-box-containing protein
MNERQDQHTTINDAPVSGPVDDSEAKFELLFETIPIPALLYDLKTLSILAVNRAAIQHYGYAQEEFLKLTLADIRPTEDVPFFLDRLANVQVGRDTSLCGHRHQKKDGTVFYVETTARAFYFTGEPAEIVLIKDITERIKAEQEREKLIQELQEALTQIKTLKGLLPICSSCKMVRDDSGYWNQIEAYIQAHSEAQFSHSLCPECAKRLYPEVYDMLYPRGS